MTRLTVDTAYARRDWLLAVGAGEVRRACGISQRTVAAALGVSQAAVCTWERGAKVPAGPAGIAYCRVIAGLIRHLEVTGDLDAREGEAA